MLVVFLIHIEINVPTMLQSPKLCLPSVGIFESVTYEGQSGYNVLPTILRSSYTTNLIINKTCKSQLECFHETGVPSES